MALAISIAIYLSALLGTCAIIAVIALVKIGLAAVEDE